MIKRFFLKIKRVMKKCFGSARILLALLAVTLVLEFCMSFNSSIDAFMYGVVTDLYVPVKETGLEPVRYFSVNSSGTALAFCDIGYYGMATVFDTEEGSQLLARNALVSKDVLKDDSFRATGYFLSDSGDIYVIKTYCVEDLSDGVILKESLVRLSSDYKYIDTVCDIEYDEKEKIRRSIISDLHYYNGKISFACVENNKTVLYETDESTGAINISREYVPEEDGTYITNVIPVDGGFLFLKSNGEVRFTIFDEPEGEIIYRFDVSGDDKSACPFFTHAADSENGLYVFDENKPDVVYLISNGEAKEILDLRKTEGHEDDNIVNIGTYINPDSGKEMLAVCLNKGLFTVCDGHPEEKDIVIRPHRGFQYYLTFIPGYGMWIFLFGLIINLIIRRKTVFYKLMMAIIPVFTVLTFIIAVNMYRYTIDRAYDSTMAELDLICRLGAEELKDFDYSSLLQASDDTGRVYEELNEKIKNIKSGHVSDWGDSYIFSVLYRFDDEHAAVLTKSSITLMPMTVRDSLCSDREFYLNPVYISESVNGFMTNNAVDSEIIAISPIKDAGDSGKIYLKVHTDHRNFWYQRRQLILSMMWYAFLIILLLVMISLMTSLYITGTIKKAAGVVKRISEGDLSARVKYKSKDELGEICGQVNEMGQSLEELFKEKDKTERFYYKFVPEQFKNLLGKQKFTDLELGDSKSRELTVLFFDIRSFSINSEVMTAKENFEFVNVIYGIAGPIIRRHGGFVDKYIGDAVMALFEKADDAVKCGIEIYRAIVLDKSTAARLGIRDINIGIGVHSGMAMVGIVGEEERLSGTVISDTVNLSSRLETLTKQYKTAMLISKDTVDRMDDPDALDLRYLGIVQVAGVNEVKAVYEVLDCLPDAERAKRHDNADVLREAIRLFHLGRRAEAAELLQEAVSSNEDHVTNMYLEYIGQLSDEDKGNVFRFVRK